MIKKFLLLLIISINHVDTKRKPERQLVVADVNTQEGQGFDGTTTVYEAALKRFRLNIINNPEKYVITDGQVTVLITDNFSESHVPWIKAYGVFNVSNNTLSEGVVIWPTASNLARVSVQPLKTASTNLKIEDAKVQVGRLSANVENGSLTVG